MKKIVVLFVLVSGVSCETPTPVARCEPGLHVHDEKLRLCTAEGTWLEFVPAPPDTHTEHGERWL